MKAACKRQQTANKNQRVSTFTIGACLLCQTELGLAFQRLLAEKEEINESNQRSAEEEEDGCFCSCYRKDGNNRAINAQ